MVPEFHPPKVEVPEDYHIYPSYWMRQWITNIFFIYLKNYCTLFIKTNYLKTM